MRTIIGLYVPSMLASMTRRRSGNDLVVGLVKHGYAPSRMTSNIRTWDCGRPGTEFMTANSGVISWKRRRSCRGMIHEDDGDDDDDDISYFTCILTWRHALLAWPTYGLNNSHEVKRHNILRLSATILLTNRSHISTFLLKSHFF